MRKAAIIAACQRAAFMTYPDWTPSLGTGWTESPAKRFSNANSAYTHPVISTEKYPTPQVTFEVLTTVDLIVGFLPVPSLAKDYIQNERAVYLEAGNTRYDWLIANFVQTEHPGGVPQAGDIVQVIANGTQLIINVNGVEGLNVAYTPSADLGLSIWGAGALTTVRVISFGPAQ